MKKRSPIFLKLKDYKLYESLKNKLVKCVNYIIKMLGLIIIPDDKVILIGGWFGERFADNSKAIYLYLLKNKEQFGLKDVRYVVKNEFIYNELKTSKYPVMRTYSFASFYYHLKAGIHIVDEGYKDLLSPCSINAKRINLWHGFGIKAKSNIENVIPLHNRIEFNRKLVIWGQWNWCYVLCLSKVHFLQLQDLFDLPDENLFYGIYPRHYYMLREKNKFLFKEEEYVIKLLENFKRNGKKIVCYMPTLREHQEANNAILDFIIDMKQMAEGNDFVLVTKIHSATSAFADLDKIQTGNGGNNRFINLPSEVDVYNFLDKVDVLISDYSSVITDFLLLGRPIIFFPFDYKSFNSEERILYLPYEDYAVGDIVNSINELCSSINMCIKEPQVYLQKYANKMQKLYAIAFDNNEINKQNMDKLVNQLLK